MHTLFVSDCNRKKLKSLLTTYETNFVLIPTNITLQYANFLTGYNILLLDMMTIVAEYIDVNRITMNYNSDELKSSSYVTVVHDHYDVIVVLQPYNGKYIKHIKLQNSDIVFCHNSAKMIILLNDWINAYVLRQYGLSNYVESKYNNIEFESDTVAKNVYMMNFKFKDSCTTCTSLETSLFECRILNKYVFEEMISLIKIVHDLWDPLDKTGRSYSRKN